MTSWAYPDSNFSMRREIWHVHKTYQQGLLWFLTTDPGLDPEKREAVSKWGLCKDEFKETAGWPPALYIRESRRMIGDIVLNQSSVRNGVDSDIGDSSLGLAAHAEDSHNMQRYACRSKDTPPCYGDAPKGVRDDEAFAWNEGDYHEVEGGHIYQLPHWMALPKVTQASNLLVVCTPSASHVALSTFRMEPAFMIMGNSIGVWASLAAGKHAGQVRDVALPELNAALLAAGQVLKIPPHPPAPPPKALAGYSCIGSSLGAPRCVGVSRSGAYTNNTCNNACLPLHPNEWLASDASFTLKECTCSSQHGAAATTAALQKHEGGGSNVNGCWEIKATSNKSYLKKSEAYSSTLPAAEKKLIANNQVLAILNSSRKPELVDGYYFVALLA